MITKELNAAQDWLNSMEEEENLPKGRKNSLRNTESGAEHGWQEMCGEEEKLPEGWKSSLSDNGSCGTGNHAPNQQKTMPSKLLQKRSGTMTTQPKICSAFSFSRIILLNILKIAGFWTGTLRWQGWRKKDFFR